MMDGTFDMMGGLDPANGAEGAPGVGGNVYPFPDCGPREFPPLEAYEGELDGQVGPPPQEGRAKGLGAGVVLSAPDLLSQPVPPRKWLVEGLIPRGTVTLLSGDGGTGKSLLTLQLAAAVATGGRWIGREVEHGPAFYLSAEDDRDELHRRLSSIALAEGLGAADLAALSVASLAGHDALLAVLDPRRGVLRPTRLFADLSARLAADPPHLLVLDTLADLFAGNENDRAQARQFVGMLRALAIRHDCAVVLLSHPSLSGLNSGSGMSGSTGWNNSVRSRLYFERVRENGYEPDPDARVLRTMKANYGRTGSEIGLTWRNGVFVAEAPETALDRMATTARAERVFLKLLRLLASQGRTVNAAGGPNYAPSVFAAHPDCEGVTRDALRAAMEKMLAIGTIRNVETGPLSRRVTYLCDGES